MDLHPIPKPMMWVLRVFVCCIRKFTRRCRMTELKFHNFQTLYLNINQAAALIHLFWLLKLCSIAVPPCFSYPHFRDQQTVTTSPTTHTLSQGPALPLSLLSISPYLQDPQTKPSAWMLRTHSSSLAMSVSSSQGFTSSKIDDLAITAGSGGRKSPWRGRNLS